MKIPSPRLFQAGLELYRSGIPLEALLDHLGELRSDTEHLAAGIVRLIVTTWWTAAAPTCCPGRRTQEGKVFLRLRPLAEHVVQVELARGLKLSANEMLGERVGEMLRKLEKPS